MSRSAQGPAKSPGCAATQATADGILIAKEAPLAVAKIIESCARVLPGESVMHHRQAADALGTLRAGRVRLLICGLNLPDYDGLDLVMAVHRLGLAQSVIVMTERKDERTLEFLLRRLPGTALLDLEMVTDAALDEALMRAWHGVAWSDTALRVAFAALRTQVDAYSERLTEAEQEVVALIASGLTDGEAADWRKTSEHTVRTQRRRAMEKLELHCQADLVRYAARRGLVRFAGARVLRAGFEWRALLQAGAGGGVAGQPGVFPIVRRNEVNAPLGGAPTAL